MKYSRTGDFPCHKLLNILQVVKEAPGDYLAYASHADSIYPINRMLEEEKPDPYIDACLEAARDTDPELELQMTEPCEISGWAVDDTCCHFYLLAGNVWGWS